MTLEEAIEILEGFMRGDLPDDPPRLPTAVRLGIEALKYIKHLRAVCVPGVYDNLPGETE